MIPRENISSFLSGDDGSIVINQAIRMMGLMQMLNLSCVFSKNRDYIIFLKQKNQLYIL